MDEQPIATLVVKREEGSGGVTNTTVARTGEGQPDVLLKALTPLKIVLIRTTRVFVQSLVGGLTVSSLTNLATVKTAFIFAGSTAIITALQNIAELLAKLDQSYPEFRG